MTSLFKPFVLALMFVFLSTGVQAAEKGLFGFFKKDETNNTQTETKAAAKSAPMAPSSQSSAVPAAPVVPAAPRDLASSNKTALLNRMANNKSMTDEEKTSLVAAALKVLPAGDLQTKEFETAVLRFEQISNDPNMSVAAKRAEIEKGLNAAKAAVAPASIPAAVTPPVQKIVPAAAPAPSVAAKIAASQTKSVTVSAAPVAPAPAVVRSVVEEASVEIEDAEPAEEEVKTKRSRSDDSVVPEKTGNNFASSNFASKKSEPLP